MVSLYIISVEKLNSREESDPRFQQRQKNKFKGWRSYQEPGGIYENFKL